MPWPVTHILTAEIYYTPFFAHLDHRKFMIGTCFPDIRYPARLSRKSTHFKHLSLSKIQSASAFQAGLFFHSYVDEMWNGFVLHEKVHVFNGLPKDKPMIHTMKVLQDKYLYGELTDWPRIVDYFKDTLTEETAFGASREMIEQWHQMLVYYLSKPPDFGDLEMLSISLSPELIGKIEEYFLAYQDNKELARVLSDFFTFAATHAQDHNAPAD